MTLEEKLRAMETLWENLSRHEEDLLVPQRHKDLLDERKRSLQEGKAKFLDWETAKAKIASGTS